MPGQRDGPGEEETAAPGGYAEQVVVEESLMFAVPADLAPEVAVLTEPMAIGHHAVCRGEVKKDDVAIVIGCGPVGLAVIAMLKALGVGIVWPAIFRWTDAPWPPPAVPTSS